MRRFWGWLRRTCKLLFWVIFLVLIQTSSGSLSSDQGEGVRAFTRAIEFDYVSWTLNAIFVKISQSALGTYTYLPEDARHQLVLDYLQLVANIQNDEVQLSMVYADPNIKDPRTVSTPLIERLNVLYQQRRYLAPLAEAILQNQLSATVAEMSLTLGGQPIPPVLYHSTPLPMALIVSPRNTIRQDQDISLSPDLTVDQQVILENKVDRALDVSSLVVPVGGIGVYPTMVEQTTDLNWLSEVISHEWVHNYLTLRPLGINYEASPEMRTINETTASIAGIEIGRALIARYYPELLPPPPLPPPPPSEETTEPPPKPEFDFRAEMHETRVTVDNLLGEGKIIEAETYMETRRVFFWDHGYLIRKLNQAYFAFYGAYADQPGGAAGEDPVGTAVRALRAHSSSLVDFIHRISWLSSYEQLQQAVQEIGK